MLNVKGTRGIHMDWEKGQKRALHVIRYQVSRCAKAARMDLLEIWTDALKELETKLKAVGALK